MKWRGLVKKEEAASWNGGSVSLDRAAMTVLSQQVCTTIAMPACIRAALIPTESEASAPFQVTLRGGLVIGGLGVELIFRGASKGPLGPRDLTTKATLLPSGESIDIHGRSTQARVGGDPAAWIQVRDGEGAPLTDMIHVGRLGRGPCLMDPSFACVVGAETYVSPVGVSAPAESDLTLTGEMTFDQGISLKVVLRRREGALWWGRRPEAEFDFEIVPPGHMIHFPARPIWAGESVGTLRSLIFLDGEGDPIGDEHLLKPTVALQ
jgi:hypothetical protein